ncbi:MAG: DNA circularization N-terminal domain-containing protein, partial [Proteobacteria bacterium]|nr:DNA circularization N-terminal domain-containing protein [Pseudomonadota bacterium]
MAFSDTLQQASFRGIPFGVEVESTTVGQRVAAHEYPYRDGEWDEPLGKRAPEFRIQGFLLGGDVRYGGGDLQSQRWAMEAAAQQAGTGTLVHPAKGR